MKYFANFSANSGTRYFNDITDTNKERLIKTIAKVANANRFYGNECRWQVRDEQGHCVAAGYTLKSGQRYRVNGRDLCNYDAD